MKSRYWSFIGYPESLSENFSDILEESGCCYAISPLHDKDINSDGSIKKPHYHFLLQFSGPTTYNCVKTTICDLIGATIPKRVISLRGYYRYLCHLDNPEKAQYNPKDIRVYNGFHLDLTSSEVTSLKSLIVSELKQKGFNNYTDAIDYYNEVGDLDRFELLSKYAYFFDKYISSKKFNKKVDDSIEKR